MKTVARRLHCATGTMCRWRESGGILPGSLVNEWRQWWLKPQFLSISVKVLDLSDNACNQWECVISRSSGSPGSRPTAECRGVTRVIVCSGSSVNKSGLGCKSLNCTKSYSYLTVRVSWTCLVGWRAFKRAKKKFFLQFKQCSSVWKSKIGPAALFT